MSLWSVTAADPRRLGSTSGALLASMLVLLAAGAPSLAQSPAAEPDQAAQGEMLVERFLAILSEPDDRKRADLEAFLAPEFQLIRADATRFERAGYLAEPSTVVEYTLSDLLVTGSGDIIVVTYLLSGTVTIDGVTRTTTAPRMSAFRRVGDDWLISAHANFSPLAADETASPAP